MAAASSRQINPAPLARPFSKGLLSWEMHGIPSHQSQNDYFSNFAT